MATQLPFPAEIRNMIYRLAFDIDGPVKITTITAKKTKAVKIISGREPALARASSSTRQEALGLYYEPGVVVCVGFDELGQVMDLLQSMLLRDHSPLHSCKIHVFIHQAKVQGGIFAQLRRLLPIFNLICKTGISAGVDQTPSGNVRNMIRNWRCVSDVPVSANEQTVEQQRAGKGHVETEAERIQQIQQSDEQLLILGPPEMYHAFNFLITAVQLACDAHKEGWPDLEWEVRFENLVRDEESRPGSVRKAVRSAEKYAERQAKREQEEQKQQQQQRIFHVLRDNDESYGTGENFVDPMLEMMHPERLMMVGLNSVAD